MRHSERVGGEWESDDGERIYFEIYQFLRFGRWIKGLWEWYGNVRCFSLGFWIRETFAVDHRGMNDLKGIFLLKMGKIELKYV